MGVSMIARPYADNKPLAMICACAAVGISTFGDGIVKWMSGDYPVHQILTIRCLVGFPLLIYFVHRQATFATLFAPRWGLSLLRGAVMCSAYLAYTLSIAAMPMADSVAIYFLMPLIVAVMAGPLLGERVRIHRWIAIITGLIGVVIMTKPGSGVFEPAALLALYSAFAYALAQSLGRRVVITVPPTAMAIHTNAIYLLSALLLAAIFAFIGPEGVTHPSLAFLVRPWTMPSSADFVAMALLGTIFAFAMVLFGMAYKYAESSFVAPFEYTVMFWALLIGFFAFGDMPGTTTLAGGAIVIAAGLFMIVIDRRLDRTVAAPA
jgi:drug/metabolite transporter (DMT)-like permease